MSTFDDMPGQDWREMERRARELRQAARHARREERREGGGSRRERRAQASTSCGYAPSSTCGRRALYRSRCGVIFGVCRGMAAHLGVPVFWVRAAAVAGMFVTGFWPMIGAYVIAALLIKPEPIIPFQEEGDQEFYDSYINSRGLALQRLKRTFDNLERRIRRMENIVTARDYDWEQRLNEQ